MVHGAPCSPANYLSLQTPPTGSEATPTELDSWTEGRAVIGTGSPFPPLKRNGKAFHPDQTNNAYVYPGIGTRPTARIVMNIRWNVYCGRSRDCG